MSSAHETQHCSCPSRPCGAGPYLIIKTICPLRIRSVHSHTKQYPFGRKLSLHSCSYALTQVLSHTLASDLHSGTFVGFAKLSYSLRMRFEVQCVQVASWD